MKKYLACYLLLTTAAFGAFADDDSFFSDDGAIDDSMSFNDASSGDESFGDESSDDFTFDDFGSEETAGSDESSSLSITGEASLSSRLYTGNVSEDETWEDDNSSWVSTPEAKIELGYEAGDFELFTSINVNEDVITDNPSDIFEEAYVRWYGENMYISVGNQIEVWGKGDKVHVVDVLNPKDYTDYLNPDYLDRQIAQSMLKVNMPVGMNGLFELAYVPFFEATRLSSEGSWVQADSSELLSTIITAVENTAATAFSSTYSSTYATYLAATSDTVTSNAAATAAATAAMSSAADTYGDSSYYFPTYDSLTDGQYGARFTTSFAGVDVGAMYYYGFNRLPSVVLSNDPTASDFTVDDISIDYDRMQVFGVEAGTVLFGFNLRGEGAFYLTDDIDGDDAEVHNSSLNYVAGFDRGLPYNNLNVNLQFTGSYMLNNDEITSALDVEYGDDESEHNMLLKVSDTYNHEKIKPDVTVLYNLSDESGFVRPTVAMEWDGQFSSKVSATVFWGDDDSANGQFDDNDFVKFEAVYSF